MFETLISILTAATTSLVTPTASPAPAASAQVAKAPVAKAPAAKAAPAQSVRPKTPPAPSAPAPAPTAPASKPVPAPPPVTSTTDAAAGAAVDRVQAFYAGIKQVTAKFRQKVTNSTFGQSKESDGMVWIAKPGKMRWDYFGKKEGKKVPVKKSFISNGSYLYVVEHDNKQVIQKDLQADLMPVAISFLYGKGDLRADFNAVIDTSKKFGTATDLVLALTPKKPSAQYKSLILVVSPDNYRVTQSIIVDSSNNVNHFRFFEPDFEKAQQDGWFQFDAKSVKNYRIVNGNAAAPGTGAGSGSAAPAGPIPPAQVTPPAPAK